VLVESNGKSKTNCVSCEDGRVDFIDVRLVRGSYIDVIGPASLCDQVSALPVCLAFGPRESAGQ
jgi:hypothetical protein